MIDLLRLRIERSGWTVDLYAGEIQSDREFLGLEESISGIQAIANQELRASRIRFDATDSLASAIRLLDHTDYHFTIDMPITQAEFFERKRLLETYPFTNILLKQYVDFNSVDSYRQLSNGSYRITGRLNFRAFAGEAKLDLGNEDSGIEVAVHVLTGKLDHLDEFKSLLHQLSEYETELMLSLDSVTQTPLEKTDVDSISDHQAILQLRKVFETAKLQSAIAQIEHNPTRRSTSETYEEVTALANEPDLIEIVSNAASMNYVSGGGLSSLFAGHTPVTVPNRRVDFSVDTLENRYVKSRIRWLARFIDSLRRRLPSRFISSHRSLEEYSSLLASVLQRKFWSLIGDAFSVPNTAAMLQRLGYRDFLNQLHALDLGLTLNREAITCDVRGDLKPVPDLYELWCYLQVHQCLVEITKSEGSRKIEYKKNRNFKYSIEIRDMANEPISFQYGAVAIELYYNKEFRPSEDWLGAYAGTLNPDISLKVTVGAQSSWLHFDSKFKMTRTTVQDQLQSTYKSEDIHKMHTYRDGILGTRGSYIIYPGSGDQSDIFVRHGEVAYRGKMSLPSVGAFPLKPVRSSATQVSQRNALRDFIVSCVQQLLSAKGYSEEQGIY